jgi:hypothetical protein
MAQVYNEYFLTGIKPASALETGVLPVQTSHPLATPIKNTGTRPGPVQ